MLKERPYINSDEENAPIKVPNDNTFRGPKFSGNTGQKRQVLDEYAQSSSSVDANCEACNIENNE